MTSLNDVIKIQSFQNPSSKTWLNFYLDTPKVLHKSTPLLRFHWTLLVNTKSW